MYTLLLDVEDNFTVLLNNAIFPAQKIPFEKIDLVAALCTLDKSTIAIKLSNKSYAELAATIIVSAKDDAEAF